MDTQKAITELDALLPHTRDDEEAALYETFLRALRGVEPREFHRAAFLAALTGISAGTRQPTVADDVYGALLMADEALRQYRFPEDVTE